MLMNRGGASAIHSELSGVRTPCTWSLHLSENSEFSGFVRLLRPSHSGLGELLILWAVSLRL